MIRLEPFTKNDIPQLIDWISDEILLYQWSGSLFSFPLTENSLQWYVEDTNVKDVSNAFIYKAIEEETNKTIGHISLGSISWKNNSARITRVLIGDNDSKGKGFCRQMVTAVSKIGFEELDFHRISLGVYETNVNALQCYKKAGYKVEGLHRDVLLHGKEYWSIIEMSMLSTEWAEI